MLSPLAWGEGFAKSLVLIVNWEKELLKLVSKTQMIHLLARTVYASLEVSLIKLSISSLVLVSKYRDDSMYAGIATLDWCFKTIYTSPIFHNNLVALRSWLRESYIFEYKKILDAFKIAEVSHCHLRCTHRVGAKRRVRVTKKTHTIKVCIACK